MRLWERWRRTKGEGLYVVWRRIRDLGTQVSQLCRPTAAVAQSNFCTRSGVLVRRCRILFRVSLVIQCCDRFFFFLCSHTQRAIHVLCIIYLPTDFKQLIVHLIMGGSRARLPLPNELVYEIVQYLDQEQFSSFCLAVDSFKELLEDETLCRKLILKVCTLNLINLLLQRYLGSRCPRVQGVAD